jgi:hypothetical protein
MALTDLGSIINAMPATHSLINQSFVLVLTVVVGDAVVGVALVAEDAVGDAERTVVMQVSVIDTKSLAYFLTGSTVY